MKYKFEFSTLPLFWAIFTIIILFLSCIDRAIDEVQFGSHNTFQVDSGQLYVPWKSIDDNTEFQGFDHFTAVWYSSTLYSMKEPILYNKRNDKDTFRFIWLRSFNNPTIIGITKKRETYTLYWKTSRKPNGFESNMPLSSNQKKISSAEWTKFQDWLAKINYWNLPIQEYDIIGNDGSQWILEANANHSYHIVDRWSPKKDNNFNQACRFLLSLTDLEIQDLYIY